jgi:hypothetical protein
MRIVTISAFVFLLAANAFALTYNEEASADTWIREIPGTPPPPYGSSTELRTNLISAYDQEVVIMWDLSTIPVGSTINTATAYAYRYDGYGGISCDLFRVTESWDEYTLDWPLAHDTGTVYASITISGNAWYDFDITALVQEWVDETYDNYGIVFYGTGGSGYYQRFYSREAASNHPYLEIDYDEPVGVKSASFGEIKAIFR